MCTLKTINPSSNMSVEVPHTKNHFTRVLLIPLSFHVIIKLIFLSDLPTWRAYALIILITSSSKASTIAITLSLFLRTSTTFSQNSSFTKIPTPPFHHYFQTITTYISYLGLLDGRVGLLLARASSNVGSIPSSANDENLKANN